MNITEFNSALPKPWLNPNVTTLGCKMIKTGDSQLNAWGTYNPGIALVAGLTNLLNDGTAIYTRFGNVVTVKGAFVATVNLNAEAASFSMNLPPQTTSTDATARFGFATLGGTALTLLMMSTIDIANLSPTSIVFALKTDASEAQPISAAANINYEITFISDIS